MLRFVWVPFVFAGCEADPCEPQPGQLVVDGEFDHGAACWLVSSDGRLGDASAFTSDDDHAPGSTGPSLRVANGDAGNQEQDTVMNSLPFTITAGGSYTFELWARAAASRTVFVGVQECPGGSCADMVNFVGPEHPQVGEEWARIAFPFTADVTGTEAYVTVELGGDAAAVWLDAVDVVED